MLAGAALAAAGRKTVVMMIRNEDGGKLPPANGSCLRIDPRR